MLLLITTGNIIAMARRATGGTTAARITLLRNLPGSAFSKMSESAIAHIAAASERLHPIQLKKQRGPSMRALLFFCCVA
jgi:hypothetical protein